MNKKNILILSVIIIVIMIFVSSGLLLYSLVTNKIISQRIGLYDEKYISNQYLKITDEYGRNNNETIGDFINEKDSLDNLKNLYNNLCNSKLFEYIEISSQFLEFIGTYKNDLAFVYGYDKNENVDFSNQVIKTKDGKTFTVTAINTIQAGKSAINGFKLNDYIIEGKVFNDNDYNYSNANIPVILGYNYKKLYNMGDTFNASYLNKNMKFQVIGFLDNNTSLPINFDTMNLNNFIIMPSINLNQEPTSKEDILFHKRCYIQKTMGYIKYNKNDDYKNYLNEIKKIANANNVKYTVLYQNLPSVTIELNENAKQTAKITYIISITLILLTYIVLILIILKYVDKELKNLSIHLICGAKIYKIKRIIFTKIILFITTPNFILAFIYWFRIKDMLMYDRIFLKSIFDFSLLIFLVTFIIIFTTNAYINKSEIYIALRR